MSNRDPFAEQREQAIALLQEHGLNHIAREIEKHISDFDVGRKMIEYIENEAVPYIGEYGSVSIGKSTVLAIGVMSKHAAEIRNQFGIESDNDVLEIATRLNAAATRLAAMNRVLEAEVKAYRGAALNYSPEPAIPDDPEHPHIVKGEFQSDKYPKTPRGKVPLSIKDPLAMDLLWEYAQRHRQIDRDFSNDLEFALRKEGFTPTQPTFGWETTKYGRRRTKELYIIDVENGVRDEIRPFEAADMLKVGWYTSPPWLAEVAEALGQNGLALNWNQMLEAVKQLKGSCTEWQESAAMACTSPDPKCTCSGCSYAREKNTG
jgi:hypothetical protein